MITGTYLTGTTVVSFGAGITVNSFNVDTDSQISASITIATGAAPGTRDVSVTTPEGTATKTAGFTVIAATWTLAAPAGFSLGAMSRTVANNKHGPNGLVTTNAQKWQVQVTGVASHGGFMWNGSASPTLVFQIGKNGTNWTDASGILTYGQPEPKAFPFWAQQTIDGDDPPGTYSITITFTGSPQ